MVNAQFEEKEYEVAADIELATGRWAGPLFSSGQVLEAILGYDAAADPAAGHVIWSLLNVPRPAGVVLTPRVWGHTAPRIALPTLPISFIVQYKRPQYLRGGASKQWTRWRHPYFRFERTTHQQQVLSRISKSLAGSVVVRYAAPAFWTRGDLEAAQLTRTVLDRSGFVDPLTLGRHRVWTYDAPGTAGFANPNGKPTKFDTLQDVLGMMFETTDAGPRGELVVQQGFAEHLRRMSSAVREREPRARRAVDQWLSAVRDRALMDERTLVALGQFASVQTVLGAIGATWWIAERINT